MPPVTGKTKIAIGVAAVVALGALYLVVKSHSAAASNDSAAGMGQFPTLLYSPGGGASTLPVSSSVNDDSSLTQSPAASSGLAAIAASLESSLMNITASKQTSYNANATALFASLPGSLSGANIEGLTAQERIDEATGLTSFESHATYRTPLIVQAPPAALPTPPRPDPMSYDSIYNRVFAETSMTHAANYQGRTLESQAGRTDADYVRTMAYIADSARAQYNAQF